MTDVYPVAAATQSRALIDAHEYAKLYAQSVQDNEGFWAEQAQRIDWIKPFSKVKDVSFAKDDLHIRWFEDGTLNVCYNCVDRHLDAKADDVAIIWEGDDPGRDLTITYRELHERVCKQGRSDYHLHADDSRSCRGYARLCAHRRRAFSCFRRLLAGGAGRAYPRL
jgi:acetyl-CoA synthetase